MAEWNPWQEMHRLRHDIDRAFAQAGWRNGERNVRSMTLPIDVEHEQVQADYKNGLLVVTLPKAEKAKPKQIAVSVAG